MISCKFTTTKSNVLQTLECLTKKSSNCNCARYQSTIYEKKLVKTHGVSYLLHIIEN